MRAIDPDLPLFDIRTMDEQLAQQRWAFRIFGTMFAIFALIALALSAVGLYAVTAYSVSQRTQEIGVRMALGAQAAQVLWLILRRSIVQLAIGLGDRHRRRARASAGCSTACSLQTGSARSVTLTSIVALLVGVSMAACCLAGAAGDAARSGHRAAKRIDDRARRCRATCASSTAGLT